MTKFRSKKKLKKEHVPPPAELMPRQHISGMAMARFRTKLAEDERSRSISSPFRHPKPPPGVIPEDSSARLALDDALADVDSLWAWAGQYSSVHGAWSEGLGFMGYPYLAQLSQRSEYRQPCEVIAEEMTRKWISIKAKGDKDKTDAVKELEDAIQDFKLRDVFYHAIEVDGMMGQCMIYPDLMMGKTPVYDDPDELQTKLILDDSKIAKGSLRGFNVVEAQWVTPSRYNSLNPMDPTYYKPQEWFISGKRVHKSRLMHICSKPLPDILKPSYNFGGLSLMQMMKPYIDNWLSTRQSVSDAILAYTVWNLSTDMQAILAGGDQGIMMDERLQLFTLMKNNRGVYATDKESEVLTNISAPLGTLDHLQAQAQEHMAAVARVPLIKLLAITPSGLNQSSDGEIRMFYDSIHAGQERIIGEAVNQAIKLIQLHIWGKIDEDLTYEFNTLWELDEAGESAVRKTDADTDAVLITEGVISPEESRTRLAADVKSLYHGLKGPPPEPVDFGSMEDGMGGQAANMNDPGASIANAGASKGANAEDEFVYVPKGSKYRKG